MSVLEQVQVQTQTITITPTAADTIRNLLVSKNVPDYGLRVFVSGGGCSGLQYGMALEAEARPYDEVIHADGIKVFIDPTSMMYMSGAIIDYEDSMMGGGFKIENPQAASSCGCGTSFKPKSGQAAAGASCGSGCGCG
ncbi:MAG: HesB/IscA family protein [Candidatus Promineifilaceae bacterium]